MYNISDVGIFLCRDLSFLGVFVEERHVTVKLLLLIYGCLEGLALRFQKLIYSSARCQAFYSSLRKVHEHSIANCLSIISSALVVRVVQRATPVYPFPEDI